MQCTHCQQNYPKSAIIFVKNLPFCCQGCASVYEIISQNNLEEFYEKASNLEKITPQENLYIPDEQKQPDGSILMRFIITNIHCAACVWLCEKMLSKNPGILELSINPLTFLAKVRFDPSSTSAKDIISTINNLGYGCASAYEQSCEKDFLKQYYARLIVAIACLCNIMWLAVAKYAGSFSTMSQSALDILNFSEFLLCSIVLFYCAHKLFKSAFAGLKARILNMDFLIIFACLIAYFYSVYSMLHHLASTYFDSICMLICFIFFSRFAQAKITNLALRQTRLLSLWLAGNVRLKDGSCVRASSVQTGDELLIRQNERILIDGDFISGQALLDTSFLTGEAEPIIAAGKIQSGALCISGSFLYKASAPLHQSRLAQIDEILNDTPKSRTQDICERFGHFFSIFVLALAMLSQILYADISRTVAVLIIACPCALSLSAPLAGLLAASKALKMGILLKTCDFLSLNIKRIAFDKTGTISELCVADDLRQIKNLHILSALARASSHPLARAIVARLKEQNLYEPDLLDYSLCSFDERCALGIALFYQGDTYFLGKDGANSVFRKNQEILHTFNITNTPNPAAAKEISRLKNYELAIISGDNAKNTAKIASELGICEYFAAASPEQKSQLVDANTLFIGDGHNDIIALKKSALSLAIANSSELALVHADGVFLRGDIAGLGKFLALIKRTKSVIFSSLFISLLYNIAFIPLAFLGLFSPLIAAALMSASSICVVLNSLRIR